MLAGRLVAAERRLVTRIGAVAKAAASSTTTAAKLYHAQTPTATYSQATTKTIHATTAAYPTSAATAVAAELFAAFAKCGDVVFAELRSGRQGWALARGALE